MGIFLDLALRCEDAAGPDRRLDGDIAEAMLLFPQDGRWVRMLPERHGGTNEMPGKWYVPSDKWLDGERWPSWDAPRFTASIDAALPLAIHLRGLSLHRRSNPDMGGRDWLVSAGSLRSAARSWALGLCAVAMKDWDRAKGE